MLARAENKVVSLALNLAAELLAGRGKITELVINHNDLGFVGGHGNHIPPGRAASRLRSAPEAARTARCAIFRPTPGAASMAVSNSCNATSMPTTSALRL